MRFIEEVNGDVFNLLLIDHTKMFVVDIILIEGPGSVGGRHGCTEKILFLGACCLSRMI